MTLQELKDDIDLVFEIANHKYNTYGKDYVLGFIAGTRRVYIDLLLYGEVKGLPKLKNTTKKDIKTFKQDEELELVYKIEVFDKYYPIYSNDNGQCYCILLDNDFVSFGTFVCEIETDAVVAVVEDYLTKKTKSLLDMHKDKE